MKVVIILLLLLFTFNWCNNDQDVKLARKRARDERQGGKKWAKGLHLILFGLWLYNWRRQGGKNLRRFPHFSLTKSFYLIDALTLCFSLFFLFFSFFIIIILCEIFDVIICQFFELFFWGLQHTYKLPSCFRAFEVYAFGKGRSINFWVGGAK